MCGFVKRDRGKTWGTTAKGTMLAIYLDFKSFLEFIDNGLLCPNQVQLLISTAF